jgi:hypothetical protein
MLAEPLVKILGVLELANFVEVDLDRRDKPDPTIGLL